MKIKTAVIRCVAVIGILGVTIAAPARDDVPLNDIPKELKSPPVDRDYTRRIEMIPMRDGVKLYTIILVPKDAKGAPILLTRTPYNAAARAKRSVSASLLSTLQLSDEEFVKAGYIRVYQDLRGKYGSEGDYVMQRPPRGPLNPTKTDHATDDLRTTCLASPSTTSARTAGSTSTIGRSSASVAARMTRSRCTSGRTPACPSASRPARILPIRTSAIRPSPCRTSRGRSSIRSPAWPQDRGLRGATCSSPTSASSTVAPTC
jgi:hypothetical protein